MGLPLRGDDKNEDCRSRLWLLRNDDNFLTDPSAALRSAQGDGCVFRVAPGPRQKSKLANIEGKPAAAGKLQSKKAQTEGKLI